MIFALFLARTLGRTLHELCETVTTQEFLLWMDEYRRNPWGDERVDLNFAMVSKTIAAYAGKVHKGNPELSQFLLRFKDGEEEPETEVDPIEHFKQF